MFFKNKISLQTNKSTNTSKGRRWNAVLQDAVLVSDFPVTKCIYRILHYIHFWGILSFCSKYAAQETWEEIWSAFMCKAKARVNQKATVLCKHMYGIWHERANSVG